MVLTRFEKDALEECYWFPAGAFFYKPKTMRGLIKLGLAEFCENTWGEDHEYGKYNTFTLTAKGIVYLESLGVLN